MAALRYRSAASQRSSRRLAWGAMLVVQTTGKGRTLGATPGDRQIVEQVAISAVRHFACPTGQRGQVVSGSAQHADSAWGMQVRCA